ncbi:hypothetical protein [Aeoliella mucimassa]|uniref:Uncharacterized protein n=1 Tax=Aeoliella mucimassa TaxID=2527972 RepID=A0A518AHA3_9BACT|nr:hypothetical protein [Aeoliella mucimassa]QDU54115.1 hypothetical protein Pan181_02950 [Aeoliella mucimassa]
MAKRRTWLRFSLGTLLFLMFCTAGFFAGYHYGVTEKQQAIRSTTLANVVYDVGDIVSQDPDAVVGIEAFDGLTALIHSTISSEIWAVNGGPMSNVHPFPSNKSLVVVCDLNTHDQIAELLEQLRRGIYKLDEAELMASARESLARKQASPRIVKLFTNSNKNLHRLVSVHYDSGLEILTKQYGRPDGVYTLESDRFPTWIAAQQVAFWKQGEGYLYLALQDALPEGEAVVVGWHQNDTAMVGPIQYASTVAENTPRD